MAVQVVCVYSSLSTISPSLANYHNEPKQHEQALRPQSMVTRALARWSLQQFWSIAPEHVHFTRDRYGAAELWINEEQWSVSFSHTNGCCAVAIAREGMLGIDCERITERPQRERIQQRFATGFMQGVTTIEAFFQRWTAAEAVTKARRGSLMPTLAQNIDPLTASLYWHQKDNWQLCCYSPTMNQPPQWIDFPTNNHLS